MVRFAFLFVACAAAVTAHSTQGIYDLVKRRLPNHADAFSFVLQSSSEVLNSSAAVANDEYTVSSSYEKVLVKGNSPIALATGLHRYLSDVARVDIPWFIGSRLDLALSLPKLTTPLKGASIVPWRYYFNTVTFSYTTAFWTWEDWELQLDWMALRGVNLPLAWVGIEKVLQEVFREVGLTDCEIFIFLSGPAFQAWNRFGNIQGSWGGELSQNWLDGQLELQKKIVKRMVELGMTPVLPAFTGFVPRAFSRVFPNATVVDGSQWEGFESQYTNDNFLEPSDSLFTELQRKFIAKQMDAYGNVTHTFTLDQYNEDNPASGDLDYLRNVTYNTWKSLKAADPDAVWMLQGWLFFSSISFWTADRVKAYLSGVEVNNDMLIIDLFSETQPQWQRLDSYYGKPWLWCELHGYGGNMGLYGQVENVTVNAIEALSASPNMVGMGLTMEGQEGNEIMYALLLDQAWSSTPLNTTGYFYSFATSRYGPHKLPPAIYSAWDIMLHSVYNNTNLTTQATTKSAFELSPNATNILNRVGHHPTTITYDPSTLTQAWKLFFSAAITDPSLWANEAYTFDLADFTRQVLANTFPELYTSFLAATTPTPSAEAAAAGARIISLLHALNTLLSAAHPSFHLSTWEDSARAWAYANSTESDFLAYNARNQVTLWGPTGEISDYASKSWAGLVGGYYAGRWGIWVDAYVKEGAQKVDKTSLQAKLLEWEEGWVKGDLKGLEDVPGRKRSGSLKDVIEGVVEEWGHMW